MVTNSWFHPLLFPILDAGDQWQHAVLVSLDSLQAMVGYELPRATPPCLAQCSARLGFLGVLFVFINAILVGNSSINVGCSIVFICVNRNNM